MSEQKHYAFNSGMPTGPDVNMIRKKYPSLNVGDKVSYADLEALIGIGHNTARFRSITNAWRKRELQDCRVIKCEDNVGFYVADFQEITQDTTETFSAIGKKARTQWKHLSTLQPTTDLEKSVKEHQMRLCAIQDKDARKTRMNVLPKIEASTNPVRIGPPEEKTA